MISLPFLAVIYDSQSEERQESEREAYSDYREAVKYYVHHCIHAFQPFKNLSVNGHDISRISSPISYK